MRGVVGNARECSEERRTRGAQGPLLLSIGYNDAAWGTDPVIMRSVFLLIATTVSVVTLHMIIMTGHLQDWAWTTPWLWGLWAAGWTASFNFQKVTRLAHRWREDRRWRHQFSDHD